MEFLFPVLISLAIVFAAYKFGRWSKKTTPLPEGIENKLLALQVSIDSITSKQTQLMSAISDLKDQVTAQGEALDVVSTNITGITQDIQFLKDKIAGLGDGATAAEVSELKALVDNVSSKITAINDATKALDDSTDSSGTTPNP